MKNLLFVCVLMMYACNPGTNDGGTKDSINAIEDQPSQDSSVGSNADGYAPPNAEIDTSKYRKDSIKPGDTAITPKKQ